MNRKMAGIAFGISGWLLAGCGTPQSRPIMYGSNGNMGVTAPSQGVPGTGGDQPDASVTTTPGNTRPNQTILGPSESADGSFSQPQLGTNSPLGAKNAAPGGANPAPANGTPATGPSARNWIDPRTSEPYGAGVNPVNTGAARKTGTGTTNNGSNQGQYVPSGGYYRDSNGNIIIDNRASSNAPQAGSTGNNTAGNPPATGPTTTPSGFGGNTGK